MIQQLKQALKHRSSTIILSHKILAQAIILTEKCQN